MIVASRFFHALLDAARRLARRPAGALPAITVVALAATGLTLILALVYGTLLRPLPFPQAERLVYLSWQNAPAHQSPMALTGAQARHWMGHSRSFAAVSAYADPGTQFLLGGADGARSVPGVRADAGLLDVLGVEPLIGRGMRADEVARGEPVVLIAHELWSARFGADPSVVGSAIEVDGRAHTLIGVLPPGFRFHPQVQLIVPFAFGGVADGGSNTHVLARLAAGTDMLAAQQEMQSLGAAFFEANPPPAALVDARVRLLPLAQVIAGDSGRLLLPLGVAVALLALLASFNLANLQLAQALARRGETALELALGARGLDLWLRRIASSGLIVGLGLASGTGLASMLLPWVKGQMPVDLPRLDAVAIDMPTLALVLLAGVTMLTLSLLLTTLGERVANLQLALREGFVGRGKGRLGLQSALVVGQVALSATLLGACLLAFASLQRLSSVDAGFSAAGIDTATLALTDAHFSGGDNADRRTAAFLDGVIARLSATPGIDAVASSTSLPLRSGLNNSVSVPGSPMGEEPSSVELRVVSPEYFRALGLPLQAGRPFDARDQRDTAPVAIVNRAFAERFLPGSALELRLRMDDRDLRVVGVAPDIREISLREAPAPTVYIPHTQLVPALQPAVNRWFGASLLLRAQAGVDTGAAVRAAVAGVDRRVAVLSQQPLSAVFGSALALERFVGWTLGGFALLAVALAAVGVYSLLSQLQLRRSHELAVRMALGAHAVQNGALILRHGLRLGGYGLALGALGVYACMRLLAGLLFGSGADDLPWLAAALAISAGVTLLAALLPARRALAIRPMVALRGD